MTDLRKLGKQKRKYLPEALIFDIDGTLLDVSCSFHATAIKASDIWWEAYEKALPPFKGNLELIEKLKSLPGFNDDWEVSIAIILLQKYMLGKSKDPREVLDSLSPNGLKDLEKKTGIFIEENRKELIKRICMEIYGGEKCENFYGFKPFFWEKEGFWKREKPIFDISEVKRKFLIGIYTGRTWKEAQNALFQLDLKLPKSHIITSEEYKKPDPRGLFKLVQELKVNYAIYIGDSEDDRLTALSYRKQFKFPLIEFIHAKDFTYLRFFGLRKV
ncbi:MAG: HAD family hydrolase [Synergistetes bacterium]|nr:HAD family hydrolase [Synergistota bacterium]MCX8128032.1 HAD family hydrolase [Synergistota bacterium]MDW8193070.1 HAD-IA family hydrolase [Synergistota bacterium]